MDIELDILRHLMQAMQASFHEMGPKYSMSHETFHEITKNPKQSIYKKTRTSGSFQVFN